MVCNVNLNSDNRVLPGYPYDSSQQVSGTVAAPVSSSVFSEYINANNRSKGEGIGDEPKLPRMIQTISNDDGSVTVTEYNKIGKPIISVNYIEGEVNYRTDYKYVGNTLSKAISYWSDNIIKDLTIYNEKEKPLCKATYNKYNLGGLKKIEFYDEKGKVCKEKEYDYDEILLTETVIDKDGSRQIKNYASDGKTVTYTDNYNSDLDLTSRCFFRPDGTVKAAEEYTDSTCVTSHYNIGGIKTDEKCTEYRRNQHVGISAQDGQGDCYLMATINAIRLTTGGQEYLNSLIKKDGDNYVVTLPGAVIAAHSMLNDKDVQKDKMYITGTYTFTPEELQEIKSKEGQENGYSVGSTGTALLEAAFEKYRLEVANTLIDNDMGIDFKTAGRITGFDTDNILEGGSTYDAAFILTGEKSEKYTPLGVLFAHKFKYEDFLDYENGGRNIPEFNTDRDYQYNTAPAHNIKYFENQEGKEISDTYRLRLNARRRLNEIKHNENDPNYNYVATCSLGIEYSGHAFTIKNVTDDGKVLLINPWAPRDVIVMDMDDFLSKVSGIVISKMPKRTSGTNPRSVCRKPD